ncbi:sodium-coupled neutral amino acid transporter 9 homolog isoform X1 [Styela clava]
MTLSSQENTPLLSGRSDSTDSGTYSSIENAIEVDPKYMDEESFLPSTENSEPTKQGTLVTIFAVWSSMMGTSLLAMPWAFQQAGMIQGIVIQLLLAALSAYTAVLVLKSSKKFADPVTGSIPEFAVVCQKLFGKFGTIITTQCSAILFAGALIVYWILMSELLYNSVNSIHYFSARSSANQSNSTNPKETSSMENSNGVLLNNHTICPDREKDSSQQLTPIPAWSENHTVPFFLVVLFAPLIQLRSASFFTRFGAAGCIPVIFLAVYSVMKSALWGLHVDFKNTDSVHHIQLFSNNFPALSGVLTMAFFMHNSIITFFKHSEKPQNNVRDLSISYCLVVATYGIIGMSIYMSFPDEKACLRQNFFENISVTDSVSLVAQLMLFFRLVTLFPLVTYILRVQIFVPTTGKEYPGHLHVAVLNIIVVALCVFCAVFFPNIGDIVRLFFRYAGAFCGMIYMFLLPCIVDGILEWREDKRLKQRSNISRLAIHLAICIFGVGNFFAQFAVNE